MKGYKEHCIDNDIDRMMSAGNGDVKYDIWYQSIISTNGWCHPCFYNFRTSCVVINDICLC